MILISACLCGVNCKYNGENNYNEEAVKIFKSGKGILVCPEQLGGMCTPRKPCEIINSTGEEVLKGKGKILNNKGEDLTENFIKGAMETLEIAKMLDVKYALLKAKSPSCGFSEIYDGSFKGNKIKGNGVTAALLKENGIEIYTEKEIAKILENLSIKQYKKI